MVDEQDQCWTIRKSADLICWPPQKWCGSSPTDQRWFGRIRGECEMMMWNDESKLYTSLQYLTHIVDLVFFTFFLHHFGCFFHLQCYSSSRYGIWPVWSTMNPRLLGFWAGPNVNYRKFIRLKTRNPWWCPPLWAGDPSISFWLSQLTSPFSLAYIKLHPYFSAGEIIEKHIKSYWIISHI